MVTEISPEVRRLADALAPWSTGHCGCGRRTGLTAPRWIHCAERSTTRGFCRAHRCATRPWRPNGDGDWRFRHTAAAIARKVGLSDAVCPPERLSDEVSADEFGVFARVVPEGKYQLVKALQRHGHIVGMCGDGANDAPALRQAQIGIAVSSATDVAKAAAAMVLTEPGLVGIVAAVREGRVAFQRLLTYKPIPLTC